MEIEANNVSTAPTGAGNPQHPPQQYGQQPQYTQQPPYSQPPHMHQAPPQPQQYAHPHHLPQPPSPHHPPSPQAYQQYGYHTPHPPITVKHDKFKPDIYDLIFAIVAFVLGYIFARWMLPWKGAWRGWGISVFTTVYLLTTTLYFIKKQAFVKSAETWFWLAVTWATGLSYALWYNVGIEAIRVMFLFCSAVYYVLVSTGRTFMQKTSNYLIIDGLNATLFIPFRNFLNQYLSFGALEKGERKKGKYLSIILGVVFSIVLIAILIPMLQRADSGGFEVVIKFLSSMFDVVYLLEFLFYCIPTIPIAAYIYGLVSGAAHNRKTEFIKHETAERTAASLRIFQQTTPLIVLGAVCGLYLVFIFSQTPYLFSAFTGNRPEGWLVYSQYARHGFFELCVIAAINLVILAACNLTAKKEQEICKSIKILNATLSVITIVLIATAFSKMALYVDAYGLTMERLLPCIFMAFLAVVFVAIAAMQFVRQNRKFHLIGFALVTGAIVFTALCFANPDAIVVRYNSERYMNGTLEDFDTDILYRSGDAGIASAYEVYQWTNDEPLRQDIARYFTQMNSRFNYTRELNYTREHNQTLETYRRMSLLRDFEYAPKDAGTGDTAGTATDTADPTD